MEWYLHSIESRPLDPGCPDWESSSAKPKDIVEDPCEDIKCPIEPTDPSMDTVAGPGEGFMHDHDNSQAPEASEQSSVIESPDAEQTVRSIASFNLTKGISRGVF